MLVIPYRNRRHHLAQFVRAYQGFDICIVEQCDDKPFNRAKLLNVGFLENECDNYVFHDIDMISSDFSIYEPAEVAHLCGAASQFRYKMPYDTYFGGVTMFSREAFLQCDGYSNEFWGWGSEDDEMYNNVVKKGFKVDFRPGRFRCLTHSPADRSYHPKNILLNLQNTEHGRPENDGLKACKYELISKVVSENYTWIKVKL